jgi:hypothetical protein
MLNPLPPAIALLASYSRQYAQAARNEAARGDPIRVASSLTADAEAFEEAAWRLLVRVSCAPFDRANPRAVYETRCELYRQHKGLG